MLMGKPLFSWSVLGPKIWLTLSYIIIVSQLQVLLLEVKLKFERIDPFDGFSC